MRVSAKGLGIRARMLSGAPEVFVAVALFLVDAMLLGGRHPVTLLIDVLACGGAVIASRRLWPGLLITALGMVLFARQPPDAVALGYLVCVVPVATAVARARYAAASVATAWFLGAVVWMTTRWHPTPAPAAMAFWICVFAGAWALGYETRRIATAERRRYDARLRAQRVQIAAEMHDRVAHDLAVLSLRAEEAKLNGGATVEDLDLMGQMARDSNRSLRRLMRLLFVEDEFQPVAPMEFSTVLDECASELTDEGFAVSAAHAGTPLAHLRPVTNDLLARTLRTVGDELVLHADRSVPCGIFTSTRRDQVVLCITAGAPRDGTCLNHALAGPRERIEAVGGTITTGGDAGEWVLTVTVPR